MAFTSTSVRCGVVDRVIMHKPEASGLSPSRTRAQLLLYCDVTVQLIYHNHIIIYHIALPCNMAHCTALSVQCRLSNLVIGTSRDTATCLVTGTGSSQIELRNEDHV